MARILRTTASWLDKLLELFATYPPEAVTLAGPLGDPVYFLSVERAIERTQGFRPGELG